MPAPTVFISYSHDSEDHKTWVLRLATDLRAAGIDAILDQWDLSPGQDLAAFMHMGIAKADRVILICSEKYVSKADAGHGGVGYEKLIVTSEVIQAIDTKKFIPILRNNSGAVKTPRFLGARLYLDFIEDQAYSHAFEHLSREIWNAPAIAKPPLGSNPFSGEIPKESVERRIVSATGAVRSGRPVLGSEWFESQRGAAESGARKLEISGTMELRFAVHESITKSQVDLLNAVRSSEIQTFGWPIGVILENDPESRPRPFGDGIRAEIAIENDTFSGRKSYDYWALAKNGDFYLLQSLFEDIRTSNGLFFNTRMVRVTESLLFAHAMYSKLGVPAETKLSVRVAHRGLAGRTLAAAGPNRHIWPKKCHEANSESEIVTTLGTIPSTLVDDVERLLEPLFMLFEFAQFDRKVYEDIVRRFEKSESS